MEARCDETSTDVPTVFVKEEVVESETQQNAEQAQLEGSYNNNEEEESEQQIECTTESQESEIRITLSKCIFCEKIFSPGDEPKLLECLHATCSACIKNKLNDHTSVDSDILQDNNAVTCHICQVPSHQENLIDNRFMSKFAVEDCSAIDEELKNVEEEKKCTSCHDDATATSWCVDCEEFICENCVMAHQRLKITKDHTIKPKEAVSNDGDNVKKSEKNLQSSLFCSVHTQEQLSLFCQTCDRLTCRDCQLSEHRDHKYKFIHEIATETRVTVSTLLKEVSYKRVLLKSAMKVIEDRQVLILEKKKNLVQEITQMLLQLTNAVNMRGKQLLTTLKEVCEQKQNTLNEKKIALDQLSKLTDHCIQFVSHALEKGTDMELLYSKKSVTNHLQRIKSRRADIPNPEIPVRIHLSVDKLPELIKVVSAIGAIVVDGRVYPSSPSSGSSTPSAPFTESQTEQKQASLSSSNSSTEEQPLAPMVVIPGSLPTNSIQQNCSLQQLQPPLYQQSQQHQLAQHQQQQQQQPGTMQAQNFMQHYLPHNMPPRSSPQQHQPRVPYMSTYNTRMQQSPMMNSMPQRSGGCHQQVTSSTHPQQQVHLEQMNQNASLRGLLAHNPPSYRSVVPSNHAPYRFPPNYRYPTGTTSQRNIQPHPYQPPNASMMPNMRMQQCTPTSPSTQHINYHMPQQPLTSAAARWHIPQNVNPGVPYYAVRQQQPQQQHSPQPLPVPINDGYKITLKNQQSNNISQKSSQSNGAKIDAVSHMQGQNSNNNNSSNNSNSTANVAAGHAVSSSVPKTPSPIPPGKSDDSEKNLDRFCQKSLNDLMQTITNLTSNGILVIPESQKNQLDSSQVDSSTDEGMHTLTDNSSDNSKATTMSMTKDDPNEDWCAVCMDGGDAVLCCDKCPKVFHLYCHIPSLKSFPDESETWQCMLCTNVLDCPEENSGERRHTGMSQRELRIAQRIVLELYCQYEQSLPFREVVSSEIVDYHRIIKKPIALDIIREKLKPENPNHYCDLRQVMADIRLMFKNAFTYNPVESQVYQEARSLEEFFEKLLLKWAPSYAYDDPFLMTEGDEDEEVFPPNRKYRRIIND